MNDGDNKISQPIFQIGFPGNDTFLDNIIRFQLINMNENCIDIYISFISFPCISSIQSEQFKCRCEKM